jgi:hypothetical protein
MNLKGLDWIYVLIGFSIINASIDSSDVAGGQRSHGTWIKRGGGIVDGRGGVADGRGGVGVRSSVADSGGSIADCGGSIAHWRSIAHGRGIAGSVADGGSSIAVGSIAGWGDNVWGSKRWTVEHIQKISNKIIFTIKFNPEIWAAE